MTAAQTILARIDMMHGQLAALEHEVRERIKPKCCNCLWWKDTTCARWQATPPADVQAQGCDAWEFNDVPF